MVIFQMCFSACILFGRFDHFYLANTCPIISAYNLILLCSLRIVNLARTTIMRLLYASCPSLPSRWLLICRNMVTSYLYATILILIYYWNAWPTFFVVASMGPKFDRCWMVISRLCQWPQYIDKRLWWLLVWMKLSRLKC